MNVNQLDVRKKIRLLQLLSAAVLKVRRRWCTFRTFVYSVMSVPSSLSVSVSFFEK